jgi:dTDP-4-amino-4,6-dideoxygalactose transaminase
MYKNNQKLPITESIGQKIVTIPIHPNLKEVEIQKIIKSVNKYA